jgi:hypothetical protein
MALLRVAATCGGYVWRLRVAANVLPGGGGVKEDATAFDLR